MEIDLLFDEHNRNKLLIFIAIIVMDNYFSISVCMFHPLFVWFYCVNNNIKSKYFCN